MNLRRVLSVLACVLVNCRHEPVAPPVAHTRHPMRVQLTAEAERNAAIVTERVVPGAFRPLLSLTGSLVADPQHLAHVGARAPGRITALSVHPGDHVVRGQVLAEIDTVELHQVSQEYLTAVARARSAEDTLVRQRQLVAEHIGSEMDLRRAESDAAVARAAVLEGEEHLHFLGLTEGGIRTVRTATSHGEARAALRAPIDGRVEELEVTLGQVLAGTEDVVVIAQIDPVWVTLRVLERDASHVTVGTPFELHVPALPDRTFTGTVSFVSDLLDPVSHTLRARASIRNPDGTLRPGMSATATVALASEGPSLWLPRDAVQVHDEQTVVFARTADHLYEARVVQVGEAAGARVPVTGGLSAGTDVVVRGAFTLRGALERDELEED